MKANEAPKKIYVHKSQYWGLMTNVKNITKNGIEYTRTDAFIEKACQWIKDNHDDIYIRYLRGCNSDDEILLFKEYMKGE